MATRHQILLCFLLIFSASSASARLEAVDSAPSTEGLSFAGGQSLDVCLKKAKSDVSPVNGGYSLDPAAQNSVLSYLSGCTQNAALVSPDPKRNGALITRVAEDFGGHEYTIKYLTPKGETKYLSVSSSEPGALKLSVDDLLADGHKIIGLFGPVFN